MNGKASLARNRILFQNEWSSDDSLSLKGQLPQNILEECVQSGKICLQGIFSPTFLLTPSHGPLLGPSSCHSGFQDPGKGFRGPHTQSVDQSHLVLTLSTVRKTWAEYGVSVSWWHWVSSSLGNPPSHNPPHTFRSTRHCPRGWSPFLQYNPTQHLHSLPVDLWTTAAGI